MPIPGETFGHFAIRRLLGSGGMGQVFEATDTRLDRVVALKLINADLAGSEDYRTRLATEARLAAKVDSPYVVKIWEHSAIDGQPYIAMEYVAGEDLRVSTENYTLQQKLDVVYQIAEGIGAAHAEGLLHRDLKPENIRLTKAGKVKIFDFGLAKTVQADTVDEAGNIEGTLSYLSPEQLAGEPLTLSSDLFSFGVILYELFTRVRPFESEHSAGIVYAILHEDPTPPCEVNHDLPDWIDPLVMKLLGKIPADRFADVAEIVNFMHSAQLGIAGAGEAGYVEPSKKVTVIDLKNLSGDPNWDYFCMGFTEDVIREISRRTNLVVSAEPATSVTRDVRELFVRFRSDFVIMGSLLKHVNAVRLQLSVFGENGARTVWGETFQGDASELSRFCRKRPKAPRLRWPMRREFRYLRLPLQNRQIFQPMTST